MQTFLYMRVYTLTLQRLRQSCNLFYRLYIISFLYPLLTEQYQFNHLRKLHVTLILYSLQVLFLNLD